MLVVRADQKAYAGGFLAGLLFLFIPNVIDYVINLFDNEKQSSVFPCHFNYPVNIFLFNQ
jgi:hypothetical protein